MGPNTNSSCTVTHRYNQIYTYKDRHDNDRFFDKINNELMFTEPKCYVDVEPSQVQCDAGTAGCKNNNSDILEYRNVSRSNMFPNDETVPKTTNWDNQNAINIKNEIEDTGNFVYATTDNLQYSFTINPEQIKAIRSNNTNVGSYVNIEMKDCQIKDGMYFNCRSNFLDEIRNGTTDTSETYATINGEFNGNDLFGETKEKANSGN